MLTFKEYLVEVDKTWQKGQLRAQEEIHCKLSLVEEVGEIIGVYKKHFGYGKEKSGDWKAKLKEECGDLLYYITKTASLFKIPILDFHNCSIIESVDMDNGTTASTVFYSMVMKANHFLIKDEGKFEVINGLLTDLCIILHSEEILLEDVQTSNIEKLQKVRHKHGFNDKAIMDEGRDKKAESKAMY